MSNLKSGTPVSSQVTASPSSGHERQRNLSTSVGYEPEALRPVVAAPREQPHAVTIAARHQAEAVIFDFVKPAWSEGRVSCSRREARHDEARTGGTQTKQRHGP